MMKKWIPLCFAVTMFALPSAVMAGSQQERMRSCNKDAKEKSLKGDERKAFMKSCLSNKKSASKGETKAAEPAAAKK